MIVCGVCIQMLNLLITLLIKHFDSKYNSFFKCNPENINIQIGGENSNLSQSWIRQFKLYSILYFKV